MGGYKSRFSSRNNVNYRFPAYFCLLLKNKREAVCMWDQTYEIQVSHKPTLMHMSLIGWLGDPQNSLCLGYSRTLTVRDERFPKSSMITLLAVIHIACVITLAEGRARDTFSHWDSPAWPLSLPFSLCKQVFLIAQIGCWALQSEAHQQVGNPTTRDRCWKTVQDFGLCN